MAKEEIESVHNGKLFRGHLDLDKITEEVPPESNCVT